MEIVKILQVAVLLVRISVLLSFSFIATFFALPFLQFMLIDDFSIASPPCGGYGQDPCVYLPAKPGQTPPCATKGSTFCEQIDGYPE